MRISTGFVLKPKKLSIEANIVNIYFCHENNQKMAILIFDIQSGISGDMVLGAALDLGVEQSLLKTQLKSLGLKFEIKSEKIVKKGIASRKFSVNYPAEKKSRHFVEIVEIILKAGLSDAVKKKSIAIFERLADAEAKVHGTTRENVHFHEVGAVDSIVDIVGACIAFDLLDVKKFYVTPFTFGSGTVTTAHGEMAVPVPATVALTQGFPSVRVDATGELVTPTGAAIATTLARPVAELGEYISSHVGYGAGSRDTPGRANVLRLILAEPNSVESERVLEIQTNVDDATGEIIARTTEELMRQGALDVFTVPVGMKKGRPGVLITLLCKPGDREKLSKILLLETGAIGLRFSEKERTCLSRRQDEVETEWGKVKVKVVDFYGEDHVTPEYESCKIIAEKANVPVRLVFEAVHGRR